MPVKAFLVRALLLTVADGGARMETVDDASCFSPGICTWLAQHSLAQTWGRSSLGNERKAACQLPWASRWPLLGIGSGLTLALALSVCLPGGLGGGEDPWGALRKACVWREPDLSSWADPRAGLGPAAGGMAVPWKGGADHYTWRHRGCAGLEAWRSVETSARAGGWSSPPVCP